MKCVLPSYSVKKEYFPAKIRFNIAHINVGGCCNTKYIMFFGYFFVKVVIVYPSSTEPIIGTNVVTPIYENLTKNEQNCI